MQTATSPASSAAPSAFAVGATGLVALAAAMGIGRFAFTPLLPLMQRSGALTLADGASLAAANYVGYLLGALACIRWLRDPALAVRWGLAGVALSTLGMAADAGVAGWLVLRGIAGVASALVLVGVSAWSLPRLAAAGRAGAAGWVYAGVGTGIAAAGLAALALADLAPATIWAALGAASAAAAAATWPLLRPSASAATKAAALPRRRGRADMRLVFAYGAFGFGYILPATFLPALARQALPDPAWFGWVWPVFGAAAAASTVLATRSAAPPLRLWRAAQAVMAAGVLLPACSTSLAALLASAVCVGGTFMVVTMAGMQQARRSAGADAGALTAAMTAAFALGQVAGPFSVHLFGGTPEAGLRAAGVVAAAALLLGIAALHRLPDPSPEETTHDDRPPAAAAARADG